jgi:hypothetical protein
MSIYQAVLIALKEGCALYRKRIIQEEELQRRLLNAADTIVAVEERALREYLLWAEGRIELLRFTVNTEDLHASVLKLVTQIEHKLREEGDGTI